MQNRFWWVQLPLTPPIRFLPFLSGVLIPFLIFAVLPCPFAQVRFFFSRIKQLRCFNLMSKRRRSAIFCARHPAFLFLELKREGFFCVSLFPWMGGSQRTEARAAEMIFRRTGIFFPHRLRRQTSSTMNAFLKVRFEGGDGGASGQFFVAETPCV